MFSEERVPCESCNTNFRSRSCFEKHKTNKLEGNKTVCEKVRNCPVCKACVTRKNHECFKPYCPVCNKNMKINQLCYMQPLRNELHSVDDVLFVFYDFETTQDTKISETARVHVPILVCLQQFCTVCEMQDDYSQDCARCGKREHSFFEDPVGDLLSYLIEPRPWCKRVVAIAHNAKAFDAQFILNRAIFHKWTPELILNGLKIVSKKIHNIQFMDSVSYMPMPLRKLPEAFGLQATKSWYPHLFNTKANLDYIGAIPDIKYYGVDAMSEGERREFMAWYNKEKVKVFDNRLVLEQYCQDDVTVLRQACRVFRR